MHRPALSWFFAFLLHGLAFFGAAAAEAIASEYIVTIPNGLSTVANHLNRGSNTVAEALPSVPEGTLLYKFDPDRQLHTVSQFLDGTWDRPNETLAPGEGAMIKNPGAEFSLTFTGTAPASAALPALVGGYNWVSFPSAETQPWPPAQGGDRVCRWNGSFYSIFVYDDLGGGWFPPLPRMRKGEAFVYFRAAPVSPNAVKDGTIYFSIRIPGEVAAPWSLADGSAPGAGWTAELVVISNGVVTPLRPQTSFQTINEAAGRYTKPVVVVVPGSPPGSQVTVAMRIFYGSTFAESIHKGESAPVTLTLGGGGLSPPANLRGMQGTALLGPPPPRIVEQPQSVTAAIGGAADLRVRVNSLYSLLFQWQKDGAVLTGETNETLALKDLRPSDAGSYRVMIRYGPWNVLSDPATLSLVEIDIYPGLTITGAVGGRYGIDYTLDAAAPNWVRLTEVVLPTSPFTFADVTAPARTKRFYRAVPIATE